MIIRAEQRETQDRADVRGGHGMTHQQDMLTADTPGAPYGYELFSEILHEPGTQVGLHRHEGNSEVYYILEGTALYNDNGTEVLLHAGDTAVCRDGECHAIGNAGPGPMRFLAVIISGKQD